MAGSDTANDNTYDIGERLVDLTRRAAAADERGDSTAADAFRAKAVRATYLALARRTRSSSSARSCRRSPSRASLKQRMNC